MEEVSVTLTLPGFAELATVHLTRQELDTLLFEMQALIDKWYRIKFRKEGVTIVAASDAA